MFWIPGLSILVFCLIMIPSTILGYKKGWRGAAFVSILLLAFTMLWVGLGYIMYSSRLWPMYRDFILKKELKVNSIDLNLLQDTFKLRVILLFTGMLTPLTYLFVFFIWKVSSEHINKYMGPKTKDSKEDYKKDMIYRKSAVPSRVGGVAIMAGSTLFISSMAASAVSTISVPYKHRSGFTNFNDTLGKLYGLGQVGNPADASIIQDFLRKIDGPMVDGVQELANFGSGHKKTADGQNFIPNFTNITNTFKGAVWNTLSTLMNKDQHAAGVIFKMILDSNNNLPSIDPLRFAHEINSQNRDGVNNQIGYGSTRALEFAHPGVTGTTVEDKFKANPLAITLAAEVVKELIDHINRSFVGYDELVFAANLNNAKSLLTTWEGTLTRKRNELATERSHLSNAHTTLQQKASRYNQITGNSYTVNQYTANRLINGATTSETIEYKQYTIASPLPTETSASPLAQAKVTATNAKNDYNSYNNGIYQTKKNDYFTKLGLYNTAKGDRENKQNHINTLDGLLGDTQRELTRIRNLKANEIKEQNHLSAEVVRLENAINHDNALLPGLQDDVNKYQAEVNRLTGIQNTDKSSKTSATSDVFTKQNTLDAAKTAYDQATTDEDRARLGAALGTARTELQAAEKTLRELKEKIASQEELLRLQRANLNVATQRHTDANDRINDNKFQRDRNKQRIEDLTRTIGSHGATIATLEATETRYIKEIADARAEFKKHDHDVYQPALKAKNDAKHEFDLATGIKQTKYNTMNQTQGVVDKYNNEINTDLVPNIVSQNTIAHDSAKEIARLLRSDWTRTSFAQQSTEPTATNDQAYSIAYVDWRVKYQKDIIKNLQKIYDDNLKIYQTYKTKIINVYSAWLRKEL